MTNAVNIVLFFKKMMIRFVFNDMRFRKMHMFRKSDMVFLNGFQRQSFRFQRKSLRYQRNSFRFQRKYVRVQQFLFRYNVNVFVPNGNLFVFNGNLNQLAQLAKWFINLVIVTAITRLLTWLRNQFNGF